MLDPQGLIPVLQHTGESAFGQLQPLIQGHLFDLLAFPAPIHRPIQIVTARDRLMRPPVRLIQTLQHSAIGHGERLPHIPIALIGDGRSQGLSAYLPGTLPDSLLDFVYRTALSCRRRKPTQVHTQKELRTENAARKIVRQGRLDATLQ